MTRDEREDLAEVRGRALIAIVNAELPVVAKPAPYSENWPLVGPGLLARQVDTLDSIFALRRLARESDAFILVRSLFEHAVTFAWLAVDPGKGRLERFAKSDVVARLRCDTDTRKIGEPLLSDEGREKFERQLMQLPNEMPSLLQRAEDADEHWTKKVDGLMGSSGPQSFRGLYAISYRHQSLITHPTLVGLNRVVIDQENGTHRVQLEQRAEDTHGPFSLGTVLLALSLQIASEALGWPAESQVRKVFEDITT